MLLISSIPNSVFRRQTDREDKTIDIRAHAINSWRKAGFNKIISVNTEKEIRNNDDLKQFFYDHQIEVLIGSSAGKGLPEYLPSLASVIKAVSRHSDQKEVAIVNADIILADGLNLKPQEETHGKNHFIAGHRLDIKSLESSQETQPHRGKPYKKGIDLFIAKRSHLLDASKLLPDVLALGLPWWDLALWLSLEMSNGKSLQAPAKSVLHIKHAARKYDIELWSKIGEQTVKSMILSAKSSPSECAREWLIKSEQIMAGSRSQANTISLLKRITRLLAAIKSSNNKKLQELLEFATLAEYLLYKHSDQLKTQ